MSLQVTASLDLPFAAFAPRGLDSEENDPMVSGDMRHDDGEAEDDVTRILRTLCCVCVCVQVQPPDSPLCPSPLQASLHSQGSEESGQQDDFVMVDFVCTSILNHLFIYDLT